MPDEPRDHDIPDERPPQADETPPQREDEAPPGDGEPRRLTRSRSDAVIGGVGSGLGRYFGVDPILFRIGFVVLTFVGGIGLFAYLALLAFVPADDAEPGGARSPVALIAGAVALGLAVVIFLDGPFFFGPGLLFLAVLAVAAVLLWRAVDRDAGGDPGRTIARIALFALVGFLVVCLAVGVGIAAAVGGGVVIAALAIVAGLALIGTAFFGGARWLIVPALAIVVPLAVVAAADIDLDGGVGDREYRPASLSQLRDTYRIGLGDLEVDLRDLSLPAGRTDVAIDVGIGGAVVWVPSDACVTSDVAIGVGGVDMLDREHTGVDVDVSEAGTPRVGQGELHIDAAVGIGAIEVVRDGDRPDWRDDRRFGPFDDGDEVDERFARELNCA